MNKKLLLLVLGIFWLYNIKAQVSQVLPSKPTTLANIEIIYDPTFATARLNKNEVIYARITNYLQDGGIKKFHQVLKNENGKLITTIKLPALTASFKIEFYTLNRDDEGATQNLIVYEQGQTKPVKGAYMEAFFSSKIDSLFELEFKNHPTNYLAFAKYINVVSMVKDPITAKSVIGALIKTLDSIAETGKKNEGLLAALCIGDAKIGALPIAKKWLFELLEHYPLANETAFAFSIYNYEYYKSSSKQIEDDVRDKIKNVFIQFPNAAICKDMNVFEYLKADLEIAAMAFEKVVKPQYINQQIPYYALGNLPELYIDRKESLDTAKLLLLNAIKSYENGNIQHQYRLNNDHYQLYVPFLHYDLARIYWLQNDEAAAILHVSAAIQILTGSNAEGNFLPLMLKLRASTFSKLGNYNLALTDYQKLYQNGNVEVLDSLRKFFPLSNVKYKNFDEYLSALKLSSRQQAVKQNLLPNFKGIDLKGNEVNLAQLRGKIVVLNVWGIGCGPCIVEMPLLNELVKDFKNKPDVVFIAVTADQKDELIKFFKSRSFDYKVLSNVKNITETFNTNALPVHLVLGRNGEILNRSIGARADIKTYLKGIIEANL